MKVNVGKIFRASDLINSKYHITHFSFQNEDGNDVIYDERFNKMAEENVEVLVHPIPEFAKQETAGDDVLISDGDIVIPISLEFLHGIHEVEIEPNDDRVVSMYAAIKVKKQTMEVKDDPSEALKSFIKLLTEFNNDD